MSPGGPRKSGRIGTEWKTQLLVYDDDVNILDENIHIINRNKEALLEAEREVGLKVNTVKSKYMVVSHHQNAGENHNLLMLTSPLNMWQNSGI
jgi:hypothetical protein